MSNNLHRLRPKLRTDLGWTLQADSKSWVVEDPVAASFFILSDLERSAASLMNGNRNVPELLSAITQRFPNLGVDASWLLSLVAKLRQCHLLLCSHAHDATRLVVEKQSQQSRGWAGRLLSPLAIRVPLFDPSGILVCLRPISNVVFHPASIALCILSGAIALYFVLRELFTQGFSLAEQLQSLTGDRMLVIFGCYLVAKSLHEIGHGMACHYHRTRCSEVGLLLLCLCPCLYCDTTDSWRLNSQWRRAGIAAAGMYFELVLAMLAAWIWLLTQDGALRFVAASVMLVCSVGTVLINSNPLLRYDGYFILSDVWGIPNLSQQSRSALLALLSSWFNDSRVDRRMYSASPLLLALFAVLSGLYRLFVVGLILWVCWHLMIPLGLGFVAIAVTASVLTGLTIGYVQTARTFAQQSFKRMRPFRLAAAFILLLVAVWLLAIAEFPSSIQVRGFTDYEDKIAIFAPSDAEITFVASAGRKVKAAEPILRLNHPASQLELLNLRAEIELVENEIDQLKDRHSIDELAAYQLPIREEKLKELRSREQVAAQEERSLSVDAPFDGIMFAGDPIRFSSLTANVDEFSAAYAGDTRFVGSWVSRGDTLGWYSRCESPMVVAYVSVDSVRKLQLGMTARIRWDFLPGRDSQGTIIRISSTKAITTPPSLIGDPRFMSVSTDIGQRQPESAHFAVWLKVDADHTPTLESPATVQFQLQPQTTFDRLIGYLKKNLRPIH